MRGLDSLERSEETASTVVVRTQRVPPSLNLWFLTASPLSPHTRGEPGATFPASEIRARHLEARAANPSHSGVPRCQPQ